MGPAVVKMPIPRKRQFATGVHLASEHVSQCLSTLGAEEPALHHSRHLVNPRHLDGIARDVDIHELRIGADKSLDELILSVGQLIALAVVSLAVLVVTLVQASKEDDTVSLAGFLDGLCHQLGSRTRLIEATPDAHAVIALYGISDIASSEVDGNLRVMM